MEKILSFYFIGTRIDKPLLDTHTEKRLRGEERGGIAVS
jgi:hypothetical protein